MNVRQTDMNTSWHLDRQQDRQGKADRHMQRKTNEKQTEIREQNTTFTNKEKKYERKRDRERKRKTPSPHPKNTTLII